MSDHVIFLHQGPQNIELAPGHNDVEILEGECLFRIVAAGPVTVFFDDQKATVAWTGNAAFGHIDLTNQVGYHRFSLRAGPKETHFDFRTTTAKATWSEIQAMAHVIAGQLFSYRRQFVYSSATGQRRSVRLPEVDVAWLRERVPEVSQLVSAIDRRPATAARRIFRTSHQALNVSVPHTLRLLRENPALLEAAPDGPLRVHSKNYWPSAVVVGERAREPARIEHMQLTHFLWQLAQLVVRLEHEVPASAQEFVSRCALEIGRLRGAKIIQRHEGPNARTSWTPLPTQLQRTDPRYRRVRNLQSEFLQDIHVNDISSDSIRLNVRDAWEIYQAFVAHLVGRAFDLSYVSQRSDLRQRSPSGYSMYSAEFELYYDTRNLPASISSWRDKSIRPANERPDIVLFHKPTGAIAVLDAKFKLDRDSHAPKNEDLFEMQGYLNSFAISTGGIIYPGSDMEARSIEGDGLRIAEVPLRAAFFEREEPLLLYIRQTIEQILRKPDKDL